jgi:hypothetical protein
MSQLLIWIQLKKDLIEIWLLNITVAAISLTNLQALASIGLILLTAAYTMYKWSNDIKDRKENNKKVN